MATQVQLRRGTSTQNDSFTGAQGELTFDTTNKRVRIHDGATTGGFELKTENAGGDTLFGDNDKAIFGAGSDLQIYHDGSDSWMNQTGTGHLNISNSNDDKDIYFRSDDGSGGLTAYFYLDGSGVETRFPKNLRFDDNVKAVFGAGSDLQIYHDGSNSYIKDAGTGNLTLQGTNIEILDGGGDRHAYFGENNAGFFYFNGSEKLATTSTGIDVTGTVTADGLIVDGTSGYVRIQDLNASVVSGTDMGGIEWRTADSTVVGANRITATINVEGDATFNASDKAPSRMVFSTHGISGVSPVERMRISYGGDISFYEDTGTTAKFFWDASAESLGIGTSSPSATIDVVSSGTNSQSLAEFSSASGLRAKIASDGGDDGYMYLYDANDANTVSFRTDGNHSFINGGGNFGIGTSSPSSLLELSNTTPPVITLDSTTTTGQRGLGFQYNGTTFGQIGQDIQTGELRIRSGETGQSGYFIKFDTGGTERMRIDTSGRVGIGTSSPSQKLVVDGNIQLGTSSGAGILYLSSSSGFSPRLQEDSNALSIYTNNSERMRIDASGNVLVGHTSADVDTLVDNNTVGITLKANGEILASSTATVATLERENSDGDLIEFRKDGSTVGSIFSSGGIQMGIGDGDTGLLFGDNIDAIMPWSTSNTQRDNATDLGRSATRFKDLYLSGGVYLGGAVAANKLDDYEEGTWTPVLGGSTTTSGQSYHTQHGSYTKIGRVVHLQAYVVVSSIGTTSGSYGQVQNLPFPAAPVQGYGGGVFQFFNLLGTNVSQLTAYAEGNTSFAYVLYTAGAGTTTSYLGGGGWGSAPQIMLSMTYLTNS